MTSANSPLAANERKCLWQYAYLIVISLVVVLTTTSTWICAAAEQTALLMARSTCPAARAAASTSQAPTPADGLKGVGPRLGHRVVFE